jgi:two-component system sensor histidine kinase DesK
MYPIGDLIGPRHGGPAKIAGAVALTVFVVTYLGLVAFRSMKGTRPAVDYTAIGAMLMLAVGTSITLGEAWLTLFTYTSVCVAAILPTRLSLRGVVAVTAVAVIVSVPAGTDNGTLVAILLPTLLSGVAMGALQRLVTTMRELREARAAVAHLAASEERLRLARDLHDLLGHSLSLIAIKSELAGRFMDQDQQEAARTQVADIEAVARQSLADVREAVSGFRRPTLPGKSSPGNGLSGLEERLALVDGRLDTGTGPGGRGFRLRAYVPLRPVTVAAADGA